MPTNANTFNSRVTSEALEKKFRDVFPAQGGAELVQDLFASGVIQPVIDFSSVAEGSVLPEMLQTAWDFATGHDEISGAGTSTVITNTGFWKVETTLSIKNNSGATRSGQVYIDNGVTTKVLWKFGMEPSSTQDTELTDSWDAVVFLKTGESLVHSTNGGTIMNTSYRQIADVNGTLVNPLGFVFS